MQYISAYTFDFSFIWLLPQPLNTISCNMCDRRIANRINNSTSLSLWEKVKAKKKSDFLLPMPSTSILHIVLLLSPQAIFPTSSMFVFFSVIFSGALCVGRRGKGVLLCVCVWVYSRGIAYCAYGKFCIKSEKKLFFFHSSSEWKFKAKLPKKYSSAFTYPMFQCYCLRENKLPRKIWSLFSVFAREASPQRQMPIGPN